MTEMLQEFCDWRGLALRTDRQAGVIRGVKILGLESRNGRTYLPDALAQAAALYEDAKVNVNHPKGSPGMPRDYQDRIGTIRGVTARPDGLFADLHFNPKHQLAEQLAWDAEHAPENVGFSHNVEARTVRRGERVEVEAITRVQSVDLVADPATTRGLFESRGGWQSPPAPGARQPPASVEALRRDYPELVEALTAGPEAELRRLAAEVQRLAALETAHQKRQLVRTLLREYHLPDPEGSDPQAKSITSRRFVESLLAAPDEQALRTLIEERAALVRALAGDSLSPWSKPLSRDQHLADGSARLDARAFVAAIT
ncbi:MAG: hypothetical protein ABSF26_19720 [Thermoguttaceae bacterium]|jgi:hypothetical protein